MKYTFLLLVLLNRSVARPHAEDIVQQTMLELWRYLTSEDPKPVENVRAWMNKVSEFRMIDHKRALVVKAETLVGNHDEIGHVLGATAGSPERPPKSMRELHRKARELASDLEGLVTAWEAEVVVLHKAYHLPAAEVAEMLGPDVTEGAVRSATYVALRKLRRQKRQVLHRFGKADTDKTPERSKPTARPGGVRPPSVPKPRDPDEAGKPQDPDQAVTD